MRAALYIAEGFRGDLNIYIVPARRQVRINKRWSPLAENRYIYKAARANLPHHHFITLLQEPVAVFDAGLLKR